MRKIEELICDYLDPELKVWVVDAYFGEGCEDEEEYGQSVAHICAITRRLVWLDRELSGENLQKVKDFTKEVIENDSSMFEDTRTFVVVRGGEVREVFSPCPVREVVVIDLDDERQTKIDQFKLAVATGNFSKVSDWVIMPEKLDDDETVKLLESLRIPKYLNNSNHGKNTPK